jgi:hypothetical protein
MPSASPYSLLLSRSRRRRSAQGGSDDNGLLDILTNVVGVLALVTSLTAIFAAAASLNIQTPMARQTRQKLHLLQVNQDGVWDLQPAVNQMVALDRERVAGLNRCETLPDQQRDACDAALESWSRSGGSAQARFSVSHQEGVIQKQGAPTVALGDIKKSGGWIDRTFEQLAKDRQAVFVVLEADGFENYRAIKAKAQAHGLKMGWEPWYSNDPIYFWGNAGRSLTIQ